MRQAESPDGGRRRISVLFDDQAFMLQRRGGVSRYFVSLMKEFRDEIPSIHVCAPYASTRNEHLQDFDSTRFKARSGRLRGHPVLLRSENRLRFGPPPAVDLVHHTYYFERRFRRSGVPSVVTVYDMIPELMPELFGDIQAHRDKAGCVREAAAVICISKQVKSDLLDIYGDPGVPVFVTPLGVSNAFAQRRPEPGFGSGYLLFVGTRDYYKDFATLVDAVAQLPSSCRDTRVICVGGGPFTEDECARLSAYGLANTFQQLSVSDDELVSAYQYARAYVFPSRREGFGLPILEAFRASCPAVVSDIPVFHEVAGDAAEYFAPGDSEALSRSLTRLLEDDHLRDWLIERGLRRVSSFTWRRTAELTAAIYRNAMDSR